MVILFTKKNSNYDKFNVECYDLQRDARSYKGNDVVIAHPPCRLWGRLKHFSKVDIEEKELAIFALDMVRKNGGILEHPRHSDLFKPIVFSQPGKKDDYGGYILDVQLNWFGFQAVKHTSLYIVGLSQDLLPPIPYSLDAITHKLGYKRQYQRRDKKELPKSLRDTTPIKMCEWLIQTARYIEFYMSLR